MRKRLRSSEISFRSCKSPRLALGSSPPSPSPSSFHWYEVDTWTEIAKYLDGKSLVKLSMASRWFRGVIIEEFIWKYACLRDLQVSMPCYVPSFKWINLYAAFSNGTHSYTFRDKEKHIDWMRIGAFSFNSKVAVLTERLNLPLKIRRQGTVEKMLETSGACVLSNIKTGIWIADLQLVQCPVCELDTCEGTMQTLDARHLELFPCEGYQDGSWQYELIGSSKVEKPMESASGGIFDVEHIKDRSTFGIFNLKKWVGKPEDFQPKAMITYNAVATNTNLQANQGILTKFHVMRAGTDGEVVSIRISQQLL